MSIIYQRPDEQSFIQIFENQPDDSIAVNKLRDLNINEVDVGEQYDNNSIQERSNRQNDGEEPKRSKGQFARFEFPLVSWQLK